MGFVPAAFSRTYGGNAYLYPTADGVALR